MPRHTWKLIRISFAACAGLALFAVPVAAQNFTWNVVSGSFQNPASWTPAGPPGPAATAIFNNAGFFQSTFDSDWSVNNLTLNNGIINFNMNGRMLTANNQTIGGVALQNVTWNLRDGTYLLNGSGSISQAANDVNFVMDNARYISNGSTNFSTGSSSFVNLFIRNGSSFQVLNGGSDLAIGASSIATIQINGVGSSALINGGGRIGLNGSGTIIVSNGGLLETSGNVTLASNAGSSGRVFLSDTGSRWSHTDGSITMGAGTTKTIDVNSGTTFDITGSSAASGLTLGSGGILNANGTMNVSGLPGSNILVNGTMNVAGTVNVSGTGNSLGVNLGTLNLNAGANVTTRTFSTGTASTVNWNGGALTVDGGSFSPILPITVGNGTLTLQNGTTTPGLSDLSISAAGAGGKLNVLSGATVITGIAESITIGSAAGQSGTATVDGVGSTLRANAVGPGINGGTGTLNINSGGAVVVTSLGFAFAGSNPGSVGTINLNDGGTIFSAHKSYVGGNGATGIANVAGIWTTVNSFGIGGLDTGSLGTAGTLNLSTGGQISVGTNLTVFAPGTLNMNGGAITAASFTRLGVLNFNDGTLTVNNGVFQNGAASSPLTIDGSTTSANPTLVLSGLATSTTNVSALAVGNVRTGTLVVQNGAVLITPGVVAIGSGIDSNGTVTVSGPNTFLSSIGAITVGGGNGSGFGTLNIGAGAEITASTTFTLNLPGTVNLNGGKLSVNGLIFNGAGGTGVFNWNSGTLQRTSNSTFTNADLTTLLGTNHSLNAGKTLTGFAGTMTLNGNLNVDGGILSPVNLTNAATLVVNSGTAAVTTTFTNNAGKLVVVQNTGAVTATTVSNSGTLNLNGAAATVGANVTNNAGGLIFGTGTVNGNLTNNGTVRATGSERLTFTGSGHTNNLNMQLAGGTLEFLAPLSLGATGSISGRGTLVTTGNFPGTPGLTLNSGATLLASAQTFDVYGDVQNNAGARIVTSGAGITTFFDDVVHNGTEIRTNAGSRTVFFGDQSGAGNFTGTGTVEYNGDYRPGNSPANVNYEGSVVFTSTAGLHAELGGTTFGSQYDRLTVQGSIELSGLLNVQFINGFSPAASNQFTLIDNQGLGSIIGTFDGLPEGSAFVAQDMLFQITYQGGDGNNLMITAVPEPATLALFGLVIAGSGYLSWRRWKLYQAAIEANIEIPEAS